VASADDKKPAEMSAQEKAMMEAWVKYATPGEVHKKMAAAEGRYSVKVTQWMAPGAPPAESEGTAEFKMILGGRYLTQTVSGTMMGQPFSGFGMSGYDNSTKRTQSAWADTFGTGLLLMSGAPEADGSITETGTMQDFMTGKPVSMKARTSMPDVDHMRYEMWMTGPEGKMFKNLDIAYSRVK
jgi:hypothetical protein